MQAAKSLRDLASPYREWVYINLDSRETMVEDHKKSESESESEIKLRIERLERLVKLITEEINTMQRGDNWGGKHQNDGGWFD